MRFFWCDFENWNFDISQWLNFACILDHVGGQIWTSLNVTHFRPKHAQLQAGIRSHLSQSVWEQHTKMRFSQTQKAVKKRGFWGAHLTCPQLKYKLCQHDFWYGAMLGKVPRVISEKSCWSPKIVAECAHDAWNMKASENLAGNLRTSVYVGNKSIHQWPDLYTINISLVSTVYC